MKIRQYIITGLLAVTSVALIAPAANAAWSVSTTGPELFLAFSGPSSGTGSTRTGNTYLVDLGPVSQLTTNQTFILPTWLTDLGTAGISLSTGVWSAFGADPTGLNDLWFTRPQGSSAPVNGSTDTPSNSMLTMLFSTGSPVAASGGNSFIQANGDSNSWAAFNFGADSPTQAWNAYQTSENLINGGVLDLYHVLGSPVTGNATKVGTLSFNTSTGNATYTVASVPEPGTYALLLVGIGSLYLLRRRRTQAAA